MCGAGVVIGWAGELASVAEGGGRGEVRGEVDWTRVVVGDLWSDDPNDPNFIAMLFWELFSEFMVLFGDMRCCWRCWRKAEDGKGPPRNDILLKSIEGVYVLCGVVCVAVGVGGL